MRNKDIMKEQMENQNMESSQEQEIDLIELIKRMWVNRKLILKVTGVCFVLGLLIALFSSKAYTAGCDFVPQTSSSTSTSRMSSLAALAGINLNQMDEVKALSPYVYENILNSAAFRKELMQTKLSYEKADRPVSFYEYNTSDEFNKLSFGKILKKYTIGLPFLILNAIRGEQPEPDYSALASEGEGAKIVTLTKDEYECNKLLSECISLTLDDKNGYLTLTVTMPEAIVAAEMAEAAVTLLQKYITEFKIEKVQSNLDFVQERYNEAKAEFEDIQDRRARFRDANLNTTKYSARTQLEKLDAEYTLALNLYSELASKLEQAKINVKETTPILTVINPVTVPLQKSKPRRAMILFGWTFFGIVLGMGAVLVLPSVAEITGSKRLKGIVKEGVDESADSVN